MTSRQLTGVRAGRHACYDRLVIDLNGAGRTSAGYHVSYVSNVVEDGSGQVIPLRGGAKLAVVVRAPAYEGNGRPTYTPANRRELLNVTGFQNFRQSAFAGSFEGQTTIGPGVRARLPMRAFLLAGPGAGQGGTGIVFGIASLTAMFVTDAVVVVTVARMLGGQRLGQQPCAAKKTRAGAGARRVTTCASQATPSSSRLSAQARRSATLAP